MNAQRNAYIATENPGSDPVRRLNSFQFATCIRGLQRSFRANKFD